MFVDKCSICCEANGTTNNIFNCENYGGDCLEKLRYIAPEVEWCQDHLICGRCTADLFVACQFRERCLNIQTDISHQEINSKNKNKVDYINEDTMLMVNDIGIDNKEERNKSNVVNSKRKECSKCDKKFRSSTSSKQCNLICLEIGTQYQCDKCNNYYTSENKLSVHKNICKQHTDQKDECVEKLIFRKEHGNRENIKVKKFTCKICTLSFNTVETLVDHCVAVHSMNDKCIKPYSCDVCECRFKSSTDLVTHSLSHNTKTNTICNDNYKLQLKKDDLHDINDRLGVTQIDAKMFSASDTECIDDALLESHMSNECEKKTRYKSIPSEHIDTCDKNILSLHTQGKQCEESTNTTKQQEQGPFICETCNNFYTSEKNLNLHKLYCGKLHLETKNKIVGHNNGGVISNTSKRKNRKTIRTITCELCNEKFNYIKIAVNHYVVKHSMDEKSIKLYACDICNKRFSSSTNLQKHHKYHEKNRSKICSICGKSFMTKNDLMVHEYTHYNRRNYKCIKCDKAFNTNKNFWTHNLVVHTEPSQWKHVCNKCDKRFPLKASYDQHVKRHNGEKKFSCHICAKSFISRSEVNRHIDLHSNIKRFKCTYCDKEYKYYRTLNTHISTAHTEGASKMPVRRKNFVCHICPSQFYDKQKLARHLCGHTGDKPFPCQLCERKFTDKSYLKYHLKIIHKISEHPE